MALQLLVPHGRDNARPEPASGVLYRCAAAWRICPFCAAPTGEETARCGGCKNALPAEPVIGSCAMYGVIELRDPQGGYHGSLCQGHARAVMLQIPGVQLAIKTSSIVELLEEKMGMLIELPPDRACKCLPGESRLGANECGDVYCELCGKLMVASTMAHLTELLSELRPIEGDANHAPLE